MVGRLVLNTYEYNGSDGAVITLLEGGEVMLEVDGLECFTVDDLRGIANWITETANKLEAAQQGAQADGCWTCPECDECNGTGGTGWDESIETFPMPD